jgi:transcriptional regulator with XRE-family HTH domain
MCEFERVRVQVIARQLIRAIRGRRSQEALSRRLGYSSNPVADWEAGRRFPTAAETFRACALVGIDVRAACERFSPGEGALLAEPSDETVARWLAALRGNTAVKDLAARIGQSRYAVARWLSGDTRPRLPDFLALVDALTNRLSDLVAELVPIEAVPDLLDAHRQRHASRRLAFDEPWVAAVMVLLETEAYRALQEHRDGWIAGRLGVDPEVERRCLARLLEAGLVDRDRRGRFRTREPLTIDASADPTGTMRLKAHWASLGPERARGPHAGDLVSYNVVAVSREDLERIREAHVRYFMEVRSIVASSRPEVAALVNIQLLTWDAEPEQERG